MQAFLHIHALVFVVFGTVGDWRSGIAREAAAFLAEAGMSIVGNRLGDMNIDRPMLRVAELSSAIGNAAESVRATAMAVTGINDESGWADTIRAYMLR
jgi:hypothetical protein